MDENQALRKLLKDFYAVTGQRVGVFDREFRVIAEYPETCCAYCTAIRQSREGAAACRACDREGMLLAAHGQTVRYRCHAGLVEVCAPITDEQGVIGYLMFGQVLDGTDRAVQEAQCRQASAPYIREDAFAALFAALPTLTEETLNALESITSACVGYIFLKQMMRVSRGGLWEQIRYYLDRHYTENLTLNQMAHELGISVSSLCQSVKKNTGMTVGSLVTAKRLEDARQMLDSGKRISEIASQVGIDDYNYFARLFKARYGLSPSRYRKEQLNKQ